MASDPSPTPPPVDACDVVFTDPPPPYPSRERRPTTVRSPRGRPGRIQNPRLSSWRYGSISSLVLGENILAREPDETTPILSTQPRSNTSTSVHLRDRFFSASLKRYFRPLVYKSYYAALFHLMVINFPYALAALVYLVIFTVTGTTLLIVLPLGAVLCFFDLLGARVFARGELFLQTQFHAPLLLYPTPYPPRPIFTRYREPTSNELETGQPSLTRYGMVRERSFYKNTYAMFTDSTSYQALFYFLVIKPAITLLICLGLLIVGLPLIILIFPAPAVFRAIKKIGIWQANVAIEGLYFAVR